MKKSQDEARRRDELMDEITRELEGVSDKELARRRQKFYKELMEESKDRTKKDYPPEFDYTLDAPVSK